jgi:hypothetical protein
MRELFFITEGVVNKRLLDVLSISFSTYPKEKIRLISINDFLNNKLFDYEKENLKNFKIYNLVSKKSILNFLKHISKDSFVIIHYELNIENNFITNYLKTEKIKHGYISQQFSPLEEKKITEIFHIAVRFPIQTIQNIYKRILDAFKNKNISFNPDVIFCSGKKSFDYYKNKSNKTKLVKISHYDYGKFLRANKKEIIKKKESYAVLVKDVWPDIHPDVKKHYIYPREKSSGKNKFNNELNEFLKDFTKISGYKIKIALHPRSSMSNFINNNFECYRNKTSELILNSSFVITGSSNALNLAVLSKKPILFYSYSGYTYNHKRNILSRSNFFSKKLFFIDKSKFTKIHLDENTFIDEKLYNSYINEFIVETSSDFYKQKKFFDFYYENI